MNKVTETNRIYVRDLNANDVFYIPGVETPYVCESRRTLDNRTAVVYRVLGTDERFEFVRVNLSTVDVLV